MNWYVLHTKPRNEKKVEEQLLSIGINAYCPKRTEIKFWSDRKKKVEVPVLPSMVLVKLNDNNINRVFESPGVIKFMFWMGKRAIVRQSEIDILKKYLDGSYNLKISKSSGINVGDKFSLPSFNYERGIVSRLSNKTIWIYLKYIGFSVKLKLA